MPQIDELLGVATVAAAAMFVAIVVQPMTSGLPGAADARAATPAATAPTQASAISILPLPSVEVVARQNAEVARIVREANVACQRLPRDPART